MLLKYTPIYFIKIKCFHCCGHFLLSLTSAKRRVSVTFTVNCVVIILIIRILKHVRRIQYGIGPLTLKLITYSVSYKLTKVYFLIFLFFYEPCLLQNNFVRKRCKNFLQELLQYFLTNFDKYTAKIFFTIPSIEFKTVPIKHLKISIHCFQMHITHCVSKSMGCEVYLTKTNRIYILFSTKKKSGCLEIIYLFDLK